jgi:hypothetical protein
VTLPGSALSPSGRRTSRKGETCGANDSARIVGAQLTKSRPQLTHQLLCRKGMHPIGDVQDTPAQRPELGTPEALDLGDLDKLTGKLLRLHLGQGRLRLS